MSSVHLGQSPSAPNFKGAKFKSGLAKASFLEIQGKKELLKRTSCPALVYMKDLFKDGVALGERFCI